ncbi:AAA family ATPase [Puniceibacterium sediminis]|uniref:Chromosome partitioning protein n=1 Tax=Puniceibacterium sediminis TaxID=1608407 RepID=A0A238Y6X1_9RHOB|nr:AAA family ATPase [Puniceibacterium sediminis]SNR67016.1 chromosome partitioning protein [Puniceibacterium sediminis]
MRNLLGSETLGAFSEALDVALRQQSSRLLAPDTRKSDKGLRRFTIREMADICFRVNYNTLRHHLKNIPDLPQGIMEPGNRRTFSLEEILEIQQRLFEAGKIPVEMYPSKLDGENTTKLLIYNLKGGVSKTSTAVNLAQFLAMRGFKVLLVDLDPQASCSDLFDIQADLDGTPSIYDVLRYEEEGDGEARVPIADAIQATYFPNIDIIPGSISLTEFEYETASAAAKGIPFYSRISDALSLVEDAYDVVLFDTPPHMSFCVIAALYASNSMLIPLSAGMLDVVSLVKFLDLASSTLDSIEGVDPNKRFDFIRILLTRYSPNDPAQLQLSSFLRNTLGSAMLNTDFLASTAIADAGNTMNPLLEVDPSSFTRKTYDRILESLHGIALEIEGEIMAGRGRVSENEEVA